MYKTVLITGATSGFGAACALLFAVHRHRIIITGRRQERLDELLNELADKYDNKALALCFDVRDREACQQAIDTLPEDWKDIDILVNNAGLASGLGHIQDNDIDDWDKMIDTNVKGLLHISRAVLPYMVKRGTGHVINIGSTAGKEVYENGAVYCASKHAVDALTKGMRIDLLGTGIKVTQISPGAAETEFSLVRFHGNQERAKAVYHGYKPMSADDIAMQVHYVTTLPSNLCINDMVVTSISQANSYYIKRSSST